MDGVPVWVRQGHERRAAWAPPGLSQAELENSTNALRGAFPRSDAVVIYEHPTAASSICSLSPSPPWHRVLQNAPQKSGGECISYRDNWTWGQGIHNGTSDTYLRGHEDPWFPYA